MKNVFHVIGFSRPSNGESKKLDFYDSSAHAVKMSFCCIENTSLLEGKERKIHKCTHSKIMLRSLN